MPEILGEESAKAIQEASKTTSQAIGAAEKFGRWFSKYCGHPIEQGMGLWGDKLYYRRLENLFSFMENVEGKMSLLGLEGQMKPLPMSIGVPLLEVVSLTDDEKLRELWANLFVNASTSESKKIKPVFIHILKNMDAYDAFVLKKVHKSLLQPSYPFSIVANFEIMSVELPLVSLFDKPRRKALQSKKLRTLSKAVLLDDMGVEKDMEKFKLSLSSLAALGCVSIDYQNDAQGNEETRLGITALGLSLLQAVILEEVANG